VSTPYRANIVRFAAQESRLIVAQENGSLLLFDTSQLFTEDANEVHPLTSAHVQTTSVRQIVPNPGAEPGLSDLIAVVSNGKVQLLDTQLEPQGGWTATDLMTQPIAGKFTCHSLVHTMTHLHISFVVSERKAHCYRSADWGYFDLFSHK
jgi:nucleoporin NUP159